MPYNGQSPENEFDRRLEDLGDHVEYPPTPDLAASVREGLQGENRQRPSLAGWVAAAVVVLISLPILAGIVFSGGSGGGGAVGSSSGSGDSGGGGGRDSRKLRRRHDRGEGGRSRVVRIGGRGGGLQSFTWGGLWFWRGNSSSRSPRTLQSTSSSFCQHLRDTNAPTRSTSDARPTEKGSYSSTPLAKPPHD